jgi:hypothetical protein
MEDHIVQGIITDCETGESWNAEHCLCVTGAELSTIVRILEVDSYEFPENGSMQISLACQALDSIGNVFHLDVDFTPKAVSERDQILKDLQVDSILLMKGRYLIPPDSPIMLANPAYRQLDPAIASEDQIREVFRWNSRPDPKNSLSQG